MNFERQDCSNWPSLECFFLCVPTLRLAYYWYCSGRSLVTFGRHQLRREMKWLPFLYKLANARKLTTKRVSSSRDTIPGTVGSDASLKNDCAVFSCALQARVQLRFRLNNKPLKVRRRNGGVLMFQAFVALVLTWVCRANCKVPLTIR